MIRRFVWRVVFVSIALCAAAPCRADSFVERLEPPALERGKTTRVAVIGSRFGKPLDLWTSLPAGSVKAVPVGKPSAVRVEFDVTVAAAAPVGICGLRLATEDGLSNAFLALIEDLPVRSAGETKGTAAKKVALPVALWGRFREAAVDRFSIDVAAGQRISFEAVGNRLGKDVDPLLTIRDSKGRIVAEHDNDPGLYFDCRFEHAFAEAGTYTVEMRDARFHGSEHGLYVLRMGRFPPARVALPLVVAPGARTELRLSELAGSTAQVQVPKGTAGLFFADLKRPGDDGSTWLPLEAEEAEATVHQGPGNTLEEGTAARVPGLLCGALMKPNEKHFYRLELGKGQRIQVRAEAKAFNSPADLEIAITDARGKELRRVGENQKEEIVLDFNAGAPGLYGLTVRDVHRDGGPAFVYRLDVRTPSPQIQVLAEVEGLTVPRGSYQPIPLTVTRTNFGGKIALSLQGAPPGITLTPGEIDAGVNTVVCKLSAGADVPLGLQTLQILASPQAPPPPAKGTADPAAAPVLVTTRPMIDRQIVNVDLIPYGLREDQLRLPPSLTSRFAVQVTPPAPFTMELPETLVTLPRYQHVDFPIAVTRVSGFDGPLSFHAKGGQIAPREEGRTRVYAEFAGAKGSIHSKILTNLIKHRVEVTAVAIDNGRRIALTRTFELDVRSAFTVKAEPPVVKLEPGGEAKVRLTGERLKSFDGEVTILLSPVPGLDLPEKIVIPRGQTEAVVDVKIASERTPGRLNVNLSATAVVDGFEEEQRGRFEIEIVKPPPPKKK